MERLPSNTNQWFVTNTENIIVKLNLSTVLEEKKLQELTVCNNNNEIRNDMQQEIRNT